MVRGYAARELWFSVLNIPLKREVVSLTTTGPFTVCGSFSFAQTELLSKGVILDGLEKVGQTVSRNSREHGCCLPWEACRCYLLNEIEQLYVLDAFADQVGLDEC